LKSKSNSIYGVNQINKNFAAVMAAVLFFTSGPGYATCGRYLSGEASPSVVPVHVDHETSTWQEIQKSLIEVTEALFAVRTFDELDPYRAAYSEHDRHKVTMRLHHRFVSANSPQEDDQKVLFARWNNTGTTDISTYEQLRLLWLKLQDNRKKLELAEMGKVAVAANRDFQNVVGQLSNLTSSDQNEFLQSTFMANKMALAIWELSAPLAARVSQQNSGAQDDKSGKNKKKKDNSSGDEQGDGGEEGSESQSQDSDSANGNGNGKGKGKGNEQDQSSEPDLEKPESIEAPLDYETDTSADEDAEADKSQHKPFLVVKADVPEKYFISRIFPEIHFEVTDDRPNFVLRDIGKYEPAVKEVSSLAGYRIAEYSVVSDEMSLLVPQGYEVFYIPSANTKIFTHSNGIVTVRSNLETIQVGLKKITKARNFSREEMNLYLQKTGTDLSQWPELEQAELLAQIKLMNPADHLGIAAKIEQHFQNRCTYLSLKNELQPSSRLEVLAGHRFRCDNAALFMTALLRELSIPCRVAAGTTAKVRGNESRVYTKADKSKKLQPHAWVQVLFEGRFVGFDPTPVVQEDIDKDGIGSSQDEWGNENQMNPEGSDDESAAQSNAQRQVESADDSADGAASAGRGDDKKLDSGFQKIEYPSDAALDTLSALAQGLGEDAVSMLAPDESTKNEIYPLSAALVERLKLWSLDPRLSVAEARSRLSQVKIAADNIGRLRSLRPIHFAVFELLKQNVDSLASEASTLLVSARGNQSIRDISKRAIEMHDRLQLMDSSLQNTPELAQLKAKLRQLLKSVESLIQVLIQESSGMTNELSVVVKFLDSLPPFTRMEVMGRTQYLLNPNQMDPHNVNHAGVKKLYKDLMAEKLQDEMMIGLLRDKTDWITQSMPDSTVGFETVRRSTSSSYRGARMWIPILERPEAGEHFVLGNPADSLMTNLENGTVLQRQLPRRLVTDEPTQTRDTKKILFLGVDVSASMDGTAAKVQTALAKAFLDNCMSSGGCEMHIVIFGAEIYHTIVVNDFESGIREIRNKEKFKNKASDTKINLFFDYVFSLIAKKALEPGGPNVADIILMGDGEAPTNSESWREIVEKVRSLISISIGYYAIRASNVELVEFIHRLAQQIELKEAPYQFLDPIYLENVERQSKIPPTGDLRSALATQNVSVTGQASNQRVGELTRQILALAHDMERIYGNALRPPGKNGAAFLRRELNDRTGSSRNNSSVNPRPESEKRRVVSDVEMVRQWISRFPEVFQDPDLLNGYLLDLTSRFRLLTGVEWANLSPLEIAALRHLIDESGGLP
jgi:hypothetical protein